MQRPTSNKGYATLQAPQIGLAASKVAATNRGLLYGFFGYNDGPEQFIQIHDAASLPANGAAPLLPSIKVPAKQWFSFDAGEFPIPFETGCVICNSSTVATKTIGSADCQFNVQYMED